MKSSEKSSEKILELLRKDQDMAIFQLAEQIGITTRAIEKSIKKLQDTGKLRRVGPDKGGHWEVLDVLSALDAKIELNNRINAELEAMAKTLYDYWFVQFDFPFDFAKGKPAPNGRPYKTSGGKMVYNPTLKRRIPEGWKESNILRIADLLGGGTPTKKKNDYLEWFDSVFHAHRCRRISFQVHNGRLYYRERARKKQHEAVRKEHRVYYSSWLGW